MVVVNWLEPPVQSKRISLSNSEWPPLRTTGAVLDSERQENGSDWEKAADARTIATAAIRVIFMVGT